MPVKSLGKIEGYFYVIFATKTYQKTKSTSVISSVKSPTFWSFILENGKAPGSTHTGCVETGSLNALDYETLLIALLRPFIVSHKSTQ